MIYIILKELEFNDICYGSTIKIAIDKSGHVTISGNIYGQSMEHSLTFTFITDQTAIENFSKSLYKKLCNRKPYKIIIIHEPVATPLVFLYPFQKG